jgi:PhnB protein
MDIAPQLEFNGECEDAFNVYAGLFIGTISVMNKLGEKKDVPLPPGSTGVKPEMVRFAELCIGETKIRGNDLAVDEYRGPQGFNMSMHLETASEARRIFNGLSEGGTVSVEPARVECADFFGMVTDRFGAPWLVLGFKG